jgi:hypothetical protein
MLWHEALLHNFLVGLSVGAIVQLSLPAMDVAWQSHVADSCSYEEWTYVSGPAATSTSMQTFFNAWKEVVFVCWFDQFVVLV